jgi:hypothetical protein
MAGNKVACGRREVFVQERQQSVSLSSSEKIVPIDLSPQEATLQLPPRDGKYDLVFGSFGHGLCGFCKSRFDGL